MDKIAVLASGGLDSAVLVAEQAAHAQVTPLYVAFGLAWEGAEQRALRAFLEALQMPSVMPLITLSLPAQSLYGRHWSVTGKGIPAADEPDESVFLPGRNIMLIGLAAVWCSIHEVSQIAIGSLGGNPFPDATPEFFTDYARILSAGLGQPIAVKAPFRDMHKEYLIRRFQHLPLELTLTCMAPSAGAHCGQCNKCHERRVAFAQAGVSDRTIYAG